MNNKRRNNSDKQKVNKLNIITCAQILTSNATFLTTFEYIFYLNDPSPIICKKIKKP